ncbi:MAG TPA: DUF87 domain-containing protein [Candidatus Nanoarchaeia archaeon]|nr:DUF87 domain-containing protein [Candidatus Nanoarchaeia archaeon]
MNFFLTVIATIFQLLGLVLFKFWGWVGVVLVLLYLIWQNRRREQWVSKTEWTLLQIEVPKENDKKEQSAEHMFASLHGILRPKSELLKEGSLQEHMSFEIAYVGGQIQFFVWTPKHLKDFVEGQIYAQYPNVLIREGVGDYAHTEPGGRTIYGAELALTKPDVVPIKTFVSFEVDPLASLTGVLASMTEVGEEMWIQVLARPLEDSWQDKGYKFIDEVKQGKAPSLGKTLQKELLAIPAHIITNALNSLATPPEAPKDDKGGKKELSTGQQAIVKAVEEKVAKLGYQVKVRIAYMGPNPTLAKQRMQAIIGGFKQFNTTNLNGFAAKGYSSSPDVLDEYRARLFLDDGDILNIEELASLYHLPHASVSTPNILWVSNKTAEPPQDLPSEGKVPSTDLSLFGLTNYRGHRVKFGIKRTDRGRHLYIIGQTGTGKSMLLQLLTLSDIYHNHGFAVIDPHGDYATDIMKFIPPHRVKDVIYFNPADLEFPVAFNPLEMIDVNSKNNITSELVGVLKRMFESWGPRLEHILRFTILALLDTPGSTMLDITRMLTDKNFRKNIVANIQDPIVRQFWVNEFASWNDKFANEAVAPVLNKVGAFIANPLIRNIVGQPTSTINLRKVMDEGKILIVNLSRGMVGEDNAAILGALMVTKIQLAAMSRANVDMSQRRPFYLYVDEFQNFATDSFAVILSEARKYQLNLTVANQYITQMPDTVKDAVFGNVGSMITFRVGATDSTYLGKYFEPVFLGPDLVNLNNQHVFISMSIDGEKTLPFSGTTLRMPDAPEDQTAAIVDHSRHTYAIPRAEVEESIRQRSGGGSSGPDGGGPSEGGPAQDPFVSEQKPNTFLGGLKNPEAPAQQQPSSGGQGQGNRNRNDHGRGRNDRRDNRREDNRPVIRQPQREQNPNEHRASSNEPQQSDSQQELQQGEAVRLH